MSERRVFCHHNQRFATKDELREYHEWLKTNRCIPRHRCPICHKTLWMCAHRSLDASLAFIYDTKKRPLPK